jgi:hypothetical protein
MRTSNLQVEAPAGQSWSLKKGHRSEGSCRKKMLRRPSTKARYVTLASAQFRMLEHWSIGTEESTARGAESNSSASSVSHRPIPEFAFLPCYPSNATIKPTEGEGACPKLGDEGLESLRFGKSDRNTLPDPDIHKHNMKQFTNKLRSRSTFFTVFAKRSCWDMQACMHLRL